MSIAIEALLVLAGSWLVVHLYRAYQLYQTTAKSLPVLVILFDASFMTLSGPAADLKV